MFNKTKTLQEKVEGLEKKLADLQKTMDKLELTYLREKYPNGRFLLSTNPYGCVSAYYESFNFRREVIFVSFCITPEMIKKGLFFYKARILEGVVFKMEVSNSDDYHLRAFYYGYLNNRTNIVVEKESKFENDVLWDSVPLKRKSMI